jgi:Putative auto-transporter adhesin, head GIN domain
LIQDGVAKGPMIGHSASRRHDRGHPRRLRPACRDGGGFDQAAAPVTLLLQRIAAARNSSHGAGNSPADLAQSPSLSEDPVKTLLLVVSIAVLTAMPPTPGHARSSGPPDVLAAVTFGSGERIDGSGRIAEDRRSLAGFGAVHVTGPVDVELKLSDREGVTVRADDNIVPLIETRVTGGDRPALEIGVKPGASFRTSHAPVVVVEFRALSELVVRGSSDVRADRISADDFALSMSGSGDARIETLQAKRFAAVLAGSGDLVVGGRAEQQAYKLSGSGDVDAGRLEGRSVQLSISGSGDASVNASETLEATIAGSGDVTYRGSPRITQRIRGSGSVHKAQ